MENNQATLNNQADTQGELVTLGDFMASDKPVVNKDTMTYEEFMGQPAPDVGGVVTPIPEEHKSGFIANLGKVFYGGMIKGATSFNDLIGLGLVAPGMIKSGYAEAAKIRKETYTENKPLQFTNDLVESFGNMGVTLPIDIMTGGATKATLAGKVLPEMEIILSKIPDFALGSGWRGLVSGVEQSKNPVEGVVKGITGAGENIAINTLYGNAGVGFKGVGTMAALGAANAVYDAAKEGRTPSKDELINGSAQGAAYGIIFSILPHLKEATKIGVEKVALGNYEKELNTHIKNSDLPKVQETVDRLMMDETVRPEIKDALGKALELQSGKPTLAIKLDNGEIVSDNAAELHSDIVTNKNINPDNVVDVGYLNNEGKYIATKLPDSKGGAPLESLPEVPKEALEKVKGLLGISQGQETLKYIAADTQKAQRFIDVLKEQGGIGEITKTHPDGITEISYKLPEMVKSEVNKTSVPETIIPKSSSESGQLDVSKIPGVPEVAENLQKAHEEFTKTFTPYAKGEEGKFTAQTLRENLGQMARSHDKVEESLSQAKDIFDKAKPETNLDFIDKMEQGVKQDSPESQKIADTLRTMLDNKRKEVQALGIGKLENFIDNYFPHIWEDPKKAAEVIRKIMGKRPLQGPKSFLKQRTIESTKAGIEAGLKPVSYNPIDLTMLKIREMDRYLMAHRTINALKEQGIVEYIPIGKKAKEGYIKLDDGISTVYKSPMIPIEEAVDTAVMGGLQKVAGNLGIEQARKPKIGGERLGYAEKGSIDPKTGLPGPGKVTTKFATPEEVLAHEIGHQIDYMYDLKGKMFGGSRPISDFIYDNMIKKADKEGRIADAQRYEKQKTLNKELRNLGDATEGSQYWRRKSSEKMAIMVGALVHAPKEFKRIAPTAYKMFTDIVKSDPKLKSLLDIKPDLRLSTVYGSEVSAGGIVISGHLYAQEDAARIINNYLSPGLRGNYVYDLYRGAGNTLNQFQLGLSAFHLGFTSMDATISKFAVGLNKLSKGDIKGAASEFIKAPFAPITNFMQGRELLQAWYGKDKGELTNTIADLMASGGGRAKMDKFYATEADNSFNKALKEGKILTATMKIPWKIVEQMSKPIMEYIVPRQKMGVFTDIMKMEIERNPNIGHEELRTLAQKAWDSVDNRMGQLVYDNLFWNKVTKDLSMASVRSLGWNLGTIRELGGGVKDTVKMLNDFKEGKNPEFTYRMAYTMALPIVAGLYGAVYQYLHTGKLPEELKDYYFPKTGALDKNGEPARISLPTYMKDLYHYSKAPVRTVLNKFNPVNNAVLQMFSNKDFYGTQIRNPDDPAVQQVASELKFLGSQFVPFGIRNLQRDTRKTVESKVEPFIGITPAPYDVNMTKAELKAQEYVRAKLPIGSRTQEAADKSKLKADLRNNFMVSKDRTPINQAVKDSKITSHEARDILRESRIPPLERYVKHLTVYEVANVVKVADEQEKPMLLKEFRKKYSNKYSEVASEERLKLRELRKEVLGK